MNLLYAEPPRLVAVLGPTNTGKTYLAVERMLGHRTGMMGFPLRLLAREIYDRVVSLRGPGAAALVTGEERRIPPNPKYYLCTAESMPLEKRVDFLALDEVQLAADPERGHIFTDRLLHARGRQETMLLGSDTIRPLLRKLVPEAEVVSRPRFSKLSYAGGKKLSRVPPRSAVVAFSIEDVYAIAEQIRRQRGGTAVVLGALSPSTRNAQVGMYQAGEVDFLVATDAIGMGLNMDVDHVAFASLTKFDGRAVRRLDPQEVAQIAGRAGRHLNDGTFGTTGELGALDPELVEAVENHRFEALRAVYWRNSGLSFSSPHALLRSLGTAPPASGLVRAPEADDYNALSVLARDGEVAARARSPEAVRLLWEVCQIPDFRKLSPEAHGGLLKRIYLYLTEGEERLATDWVARQIDRIDRIDGDVDALTTRIAHIRTWTYVSHRRDWIVDAREWQERSRGIEDRLSDALHERLTQRFVDRRAADLARRMRSEQGLLGAVNRAGEIVVEGHVVGRLQGFRFQPEETDDRASARAVKAAGRRILTQEMPYRLGRFVAEPDEAFALGEHGTIVWNGAPVARLLPGESSLRPQIDPLRTDLLDGPARERVRRRLVPWLDGYLAEALAPLIRLREAPLSGPARGLAFQLTEALGTLPRREVRDQLKALTPADRRALARLGIRMGRLDLYLQGLQQRESVRTRAQLWCVRSGLRTLPALPPPGYIALAVDPNLPDGFYRAIGYEVLGPRAIRIDRAERLAAQARRLARRGPFGLEAGLLALAACDAATLIEVLTALGFRPVGEGGSPRFAAPEREADGAGASKTKRASRRGRRQGPPPDPHSPFAKLRRLALGDESPRR